MAEFNVWLLIVGIAAGAAVTWLVVGTLSRSDDEIAAAEQATEAIWIARLIEEHGGRVPVALVEQILELHRRYRKGGPGIPLPEEMVPEEPAPSEGSAPEEPAPVEGSAPVEEPAPPEAVPAQPPPAAPPASAVDERAETPAR